MAVDAGRTGAGVPMPTAADYLPPLLLRNPHLQSVLGSSHLRRLRGRLAGRPSDEHREPVQGVPFDDVGTLRAQPCRAPHVDVTARDDDERHVPALRPCQGERGPDVGLSGALQLRHDDVGAQLYERLGEARQSGDPLDGARLRGMPEHPLQARRRHGRAAREKNSDRTAQLLRSH